MRRVGLLLVVSLGLGSGFGAWLCPTAVAVEWTSPTVVPGSRGAVISQVAISGQDVVAVAGESAFVAIRLRGGRWLRVHRISGSNRLVSSIDIAFDARGRLFVVWTQARRRPGAGYAGPFEIRTQTWTQAKGWGRVQTLGRSGHFLLASPRIAVDRRGDAIIFWRGVRHAGRHTLEAVSTSFRPADRGWERTQQISGGGPYRDVTLDAKGNAYAVWTTYAARNYFSMRPRRSGRWGSPRRLPGGPASLPAVAATPQGAAVIAWRAAIVDSEGEGTQFGPVRAIVRSPRGRWGRAQALSSIRVHEVHAAVSPATGAVLLSWGAPPQAMEPVPGATDMHFSLFSGSGTTLSPERDAPGTAAGPLVYRPNGDAIVVFGQEALDLRAGPAGSIRFSALVPREPTFSEPVLVVAHGRLPSLAGAPKKSGPIEAAMTYYDEANKRFALSLLTVSGNEPRP
ncbi:MAG TPA: hypothetical protein VII01_18230 [Solirubrobacteraceae bacterium]